MNKFLPLLFSFTLLVFSSCKEATPADAVEATFNKIKEDAAKGNTDAVLAAISQPSKDYLTKIKELASNPTEETIDQFCEKQAFSLATRFLIQSAINEKELANKDSNPVKNILEILALKGVGLFHVGNGNYSFKEVDEMTGNKAVATMRVKVEANRALTSKINFEKEAEAWKMDVMSTFSFFDKFLKQQWHTTGGSAKTFVEDFVENGGSGTSLYLQVR